MLNLVPWVPLDENGKLRYPSATEKTLWYRILKDKILTHKPKKCFLFWKHVQDLFIKDSDYIVFGNDLTRKSCFEKIRNIEMEIFEKLKH